MSPCKHRFMLVIHVSIIPHPCCYITLDYLKKSWYSICMSVTIKSFSPGFVLSLQSAIKSGPIYGKCRVLGCLIPIEKYKMGTTRFFLQAITTMQCHERFQQPLLYWLMYISRHSSIRSIRRTPWWPHYKTCRWFQTQIHVSIQDFNCVFSLYDRHDYNRRENYYWDDERLFGPKKWMGMQCQDVGDVVEEVQIKWRSLKGLFCGLCVYKMMKRAWKGLHSDCLPWFALFSTSFYPWSCINWLSCDNQKLHTLHLCVINPLIGSVKGCAHVQKNSHSGVNWRSRLYIAIYNH